MALAEAPAGLLTYEGYITEGEINRRYDIIDGERFYMASPTDVATRRAVHRLGTLRRAELAEYGTVVPSTRTRRGGAVAERNAQHPRG